MSDLCEHETFRSICGICHRDNIITRLRAENEKLRAALEIARTYIFVSTFELSVHPEQATVDLTIVDAVLSTSQPEPQKENSMTDITIPPEALEAAAIAEWEHERCRVSGLPPFEELHPAIKKRALDRVNSVCQAMLNAWPGMVQYPVMEIDCTPPKIVLPLPTESTNAEG